LSGRTEEGNSVGVSCPVLNPVLLTGLEYSSSMLDTALATCSEEKLKSGRKINYHVME
jgi:hypothetical protein